MLNSYAHFLQEMADRLLELANRAPDIGSELRQFAAELIEVANQAEKRKDRSRDLQD